MQPRAEVRYHTGHRTRISSSISRACTSKLKRPLNTAQSDLHRFGPNRSRKGMREICFKRPLTLARSPPPRRYRPLQVRLPLRSRRAGLRTVNWTGRSRERGCQEKARARKPQIIKPRELGARAGAGVLCASCCRFSLRRRKRVRERVRVRVHELLK